MTITGYMTITGLRWVRTVDRSTGAWGGWTLEYKCVDEDGYPMDWEPVEIVEFNEDGSER